MSTGETSESSSNLDRPVHSGRPPTNLWLAVASPKLKHKTSL